MSLDGVLSGNVSPELQAQRHAARQTELGVVVACFGPLPQF